MSINEVARSQEERNPNEKLRVAGSSLLPKLTAKLGSLRKLSEG